MRFLDHLPSSFKETITIRREGGGFRGDEEEDIATVEAWVKPETGSTALNGGVPTTDFFFTVHLAEPVADAYPEDKIIRENGEPELRVVRPIPLGGDVMKLIARQVRIA